jgi:hypothetical protein
MTRAGRADWDTRAHHSIDDYAALAADGTPLPIPDGRGPSSPPVPGRVGCACGVVSPWLPTKAARQRWHTRHREEADRAPWSDVVRDGERASKWPEILNAGVPGRAATYYAWRERSRNCWEATAQEGFVVRVAVIETADGGGESWIGHSISDTLGAGAVETLYFRMLDLLAERTRAAGWEVGCRVCGEAWPCPVRELISHPHPQALPRPDALDHVPYGVLRT